MSGNDLLAAWYDDPAIRCGAYLESFGNAPKFARLARRFAERKPLLAVVGGRSSGRGRCVAHCRGRDSRGRRRRPLRPGRRHRAAECGGDGADGATPRGSATPRWACVAIVSNAGGIGVLAADAAAILGLEVPSSRPPQGPARAKCPARPAPATPSTSAPAPPPTISRGWSDHCSPRRKWTRCSWSWCRRASPLRNRSSTPLAAARSRFPDKPVVLVGPGRFGDGAAGVTVFRVVDDAVVALGHAARYAEWLAHPRGPLQAPSDPERADAARTAARALVDDIGTGSGGVDAADVPRLLQSYGLEASGRHRARPHRRRTPCRPRWASPSSSRSPTATSSTRPTAASFGSD